MKFIRALFVWLVGLAMTSAMIVVAYLWLDRPIALWAHDNLRNSHYRIFSEVVNIPDPLVILATFGFALLGLRLMIAKRLSKYQAPAFVCCSSILLSEAIKDQLKYVFGRTWPETWSWGNESFIRDGVYGFHFMHGGAAYQSFPSGHMGATCAAISVLWFWFPRWRWLYVIAGLAVEAGLVIGNYHFLSDVIAGAFVGLSTGLGVITIWKIARPLMIGRVRDSESRE